MKKVLILAYDFPPYVSVGGLRPYGWFKYLRDNDVYPVVVVRQWNNTFNNALDYISAGESSENIYEESENGLLIKTPYYPNLANKIYLRFGENRFRLVRKVITAFYEFGQFIFPIGSKRNILRAADEYLKKEKVDVIVATGDPFILFRYAATLSQKYQIPWVADYRDPWSKDPAFENNILLKKWNMFNEKKALKNVSVITTVSPFIQHQIESLLPSKRIEIIPNGYDHVSFSKLGQYKQSENVLNIGFAGSLQNWHPIRSFLSAVSMFLQQYPDAQFCVNFYGVNKQIELENLLDNDFQSIKKYTRFFQKMPNNELVPLLAQNNLLLLFNDFFFIGTKIYDYLALRRTILFCYANDADALALKENFYHVDVIKGCSDHVQEDLIKSTNSGYIVQNQSHLVKLLDQLYKTFMAHGLLDCQSQGYEGFSRQKQTRRFAEIIHSIS